MESIVPEQVARGVGQRRVEPHATPSPQDCFRCSRIFTTEEDVDGLRDMRDAGQKRNRLAAQPRRVSRAVPVLVERPDRHGRPLGAAKLLGDRSAALAANGDEFTGGIPIPRHPDEMADLGPPRATMGRVAPGLHGEQATIIPVDKLHPRLHTLVVGPEQRRNASGVRRTPGVLQQQRVVELRELLRIQPRGFAQPHADEARPQAVAGRLPLGEIEGARQRSNDLRHRQQRRWPTSARTSWRGGFRGGHVVVTAASRTTLSALRFYAAPGL